LRHSHISEEMESRALRAFSRAATRLPAIDVVLALSKARMSRRSALSSGASGALMPMTASRPRQAASSSTAMSSSVRWMWTSRMRAVSSARST